MSDTAVGRAGTDRRGEIVLTPQGYARLQRELATLVTVNRAEARARLSQALQIAGDLADNPEYLDASAELARVESRIVLLEERIATARVLRTDEPSSGVVSLGSRVQLDDLDDGSSEEYVLVSSAESNPSKGRLSNESPVGRAIEGHHPGEIVEVRAPHGIRHLRIARIARARIAA